MAALDGKHHPYISGMDKDAVIAKLRAHEEELRAAGVQALSISAPLQEATLLWNPISTCS